jgi:xylulokinase
VGEPWILAIDLGTGGPKTGAVSLRGDILGHAFRGVRTCLTPDGGATQNPEDWWSGIRDGVREVLAAGVAAPGDVVGVGITGQWGSTVPVDADGRAAGDCLLWADDRGGRFAAAALGGPVRIFGYAPSNVIRWIQLTGGAPSPNGADPLGHQLYLRSCEPEIYARTRTCLEPLDYVGLRLTGRMAATPASMTLSWLTDNRPGAPLRYVPELVRRSRRDAALLPGLIPTGSVLGELLPAVGGDLGLPAGIPVVAGVPDLHTAVIGSGAMGLFEGHLTISTTAWISCEVPFKRTDVVRQVASVPGLRPGRYVVADNHETAGACLSWLRDAVISPNDPLTVHREVAYEDLTRLAAGVPAGAGGVIFTPWLKGERTPVDDRRLRAAFLNVSLGTERAHLVRAVLEGVAYNARWLLDAVERFAGRSLPTLRILGGGAASELWCRIHADVLGRRIEQVAEPMQANLRGAALFAAIALGRVTRCEAAAAVRVAAAYDPDPDGRAVYEPVYREFRQLHGRLRGPYSRLNR